MSYDVAIAGGGLAGLSASILLARKGYQVALFEKEKYPFHKVCGEYISLESRNLLLSLGLPIDALPLPVINRLVLTSTNGTVIDQQLPLGGIGISRYKIDFDLKTIAQQLGVAVHENTKVNDIHFNDNRFAVNTTAGDFRVPVCCAATGKRSNLDLKWKRKFTANKPNALNNFIGVKYHAVLNHPRNVIALHNFTDGYCGISPVEENTSCICYLTTAANLRMTGNDIRTMEREILYKNKHIEEAFENGTMLYDKPLTISQISFDRKEQVYGHVLLLGDSAGMIAPLCGNGMSMALFSGQIAAHHIDSFLRDGISRFQLEENYSLEWRSRFARRLFTGRVIQSLFGRDWVTNTTIGVLKRFPRLVSTIIRQTHG